MKKLFLFFILAGFFPLAIQAEQILQSSESFMTAKVVKLGRGSVNTGYSSINLSAEYTELLEECDDNCLESSCNRQTGVCSACKPGRYLKNNLCLACPDNATCSGNSSFKCNASYRKAGETCLGLCSGVSCKSGFTATVKSDQCCCS